MARHLALVVLATLLGVAGCATTPVTTSPGAGTAPPPEAGVPSATGEAPDAASAAPPPSPDTATLALLQQSERAAQSGSLDAAMAYAERAVRLDPHRADLWTRLAELTLADGDPDTAIRYANKALTLARDRVDWQRDAWLIIADAREAQGDNDAARAIRERWQTHRG